MLIVGNGGRTVERQIVNQGDGGLTPPTCCCFETLAIFLLHICLCLSEETLKAGGPFYMVSVHARGSKRSHTGNKYVTCSGLINSREGQL